MGPGVGGDGRATRDVGRIADGIAPATGVSTKKIAAVRHVPARGQRLASWWNRAGVPEGRANVARDRAQRNPWNCRSRDARSPEGATAASVAPPGLKQLAPGCQGFAPLTPGHVRP